MVRLGSSEATEFVVEGDGLGAPGASSVLTFIHLSEEETGDEKSEDEIYEVRSADRSPRTFDCMARLSTSPRNLHDFNMNDDPKLGSSYICVEDNGIDAIDFAVPGGTIRVRINDNRELSSASSNVTATDPNIARQVFESRISIFLDRFSFLYNVPIYLTMTVVKDRKNRASHLYFISPPQYQYIRTNGERLHSEMIPIYALYREAQNASSPYYRVLCLYKIIDGLLTSLRAEALRDVDLRARNRLFPKSVVPDHPQISNGLRSFVGKPIKSFADEFLQSRFRDAVAHFELTKKGRRRLNVSDAREVGIFAEIAFLADLCARELIEQHENALENIHASSLAGS